MKKLISTKDIINKIAKEIGLETKLTEAKILQSWKKEVGEKISDHTTPIKIFKGKLFVKVDSSVWVNQLTFIKKDIIDKLNKAITGNSIKDIFFTLK